MASKAADIAKQPKDKKFKLYEQLIDQLIKSKDCKSIQEVVDHLIKKEGNDQHGRTYITPDMLQHIIKKLSPENVKEADQIDLEDLLPLMEAIVPMIRDKGEDFPDALMNAVYLLYQLYTAEEDWKKAAFTLTSFRFDKFRGSAASPARQVSWHVDTAECWLECGETGSASQAIKKAHSLVNLIKDEPKLVLRFRTAYARTLDSERKFFEAAIHYKKISQTAQGIMSEGDIMKTLENAVTCAILAKAGPPRSRVLAMLYSDERAQALANYGLLEKMFKGRVIRENEVKQFEKMLQPHQNADTATGRTVLQNSIVEHNIVAASEMYNNIKFDQLGGLLNIPAKQAEELAQQMIEQGRLKGSIDQVEHVVEFEESDVSAGSLSTWDHQIQELCLVVNHVLENVAAKYPQYKY